MAGSGEVCISQYVGSRGSRGFDVVVGGKCLLRANDFESHGKGRGVSAERNIYLFYTTRLGISFGTKRMAAG